MSGEVSIYEALGTEAAIDQVEQLPWYPVESSNVLRIAWCKTDAIAQRESRAFEVGWLWMQFRGGKVYAYAKVPLAIYAALQGAESVGKAHAALVKGRYRYAALDPHTGMTYVGVADGSGLVPDERS